MTTKKKAVKLVEPERPRVQDAYSSFSVYSLQNGSKRPDVKRQKVSISAKLRAWGSLAAVERSVAEFAAKHGVDPGKVALTVAGAYSPCLMASATREETDAELAARQREVDKWNRALAAYRADRDAVTAWRAAADKRADDAVKAREAERLARRKAAEEKAAKAAAVEVKREVMESLRRDAKFLATITDEVLSDEKFVRSLRAIFTAKAGS